MKPETTREMRKMTSEIEIRYRSCVSEESFTIKQDVDVRELMMRIGHFADNIEYKEMMYALYVNNAGRVVGVMKVSEGTSDCCLFDKKFLFQGAILQNVNNIILVHNHPSGTLTPSSKDIELTRGVRRACEIMGMQLMDHVIITRDGYSSINAYV